MSNKTVAEIWVTIPKKKRKDIISFWEGGILPISLFKELNKEQLTIFYFLTNEIEKAKGVKYDTQLLKNMEEYI